jgi:hypothetical protein
LGTWNVPDPHARQWRRTKHRHHRKSRWVRYSAIALAAVLAVALAWRGVRWTLSPDNAPTADIAASYSSLASSALPDADARNAGWQNDFNVALASAEQDVADGQLGAGEIALDRAETVLTTERLIGASANPEFFAPALSALDRLAARKPADTRLFEHVTLTRISLAEFQTSLTAEPVGTADAKRVAIGVPREVAAGETLDPSSFNGKILDASLMPDTSEILVPPSSRSFKDGILVENLVMQGAAQTLDGVHWRNVIFVGTRLRYQGGELDLKDVQFVRCRFGFVTDERGANLASAIAQGKTSIQIL